MKNYIITADERQLEIPGIAKETFRNDTTEPTMTADGTRRYDTSHGSSVIAEIETSPRQASNTAFQKLQGYLKGRAWQRETVYLDRLQGSIQAYIRISQVDTNMRGTIRNKRAMKIIITQS